MQYITYILTLTMLLSISPLAQAQKMKKESVDGYKVEIQTSAICDMCKYTLEKDLAFEKGVKKATLDLETKVMTIVYNEKKTSPEKLRNRINKVGYHADWMPRDATAYEKLPMCCQDGSHGTAIPQVPTKKPE